MKNSKYTVEFTQKGWAVFYSSGYTVKMVTKPRAGDAGRKIATDAAAFLNNQNGV